MYTYTNLEKFEAWLSHVLKEYLGNINDYLEDLDRQYSSTGSACYEESSRLTKSGNTESYYYEVRDDFDEDDEFIGREFIF